MPMNTFRKTIVILSLLLPFLSVAAQGLLLQNGCRRGYLLPRQTGTNASKAVRKAGTSVAAYQGDRHQLLVLAQFADKEFADADPLSVWGRIFNEPDFHEEPFVGSVHDYFFAQSYGQLRLTFDMHLVQVDSLAKYRSTSSHDENSQYLVGDIIDTLMTRDVDWSLYDWDGDGTIEHLLILYAGMGMHDGGGKNTIWPHQWWMSEHIDMTAVGDSIVYNKARTVSYDGQNYLVDCYCVVNEIGKTSAPFGTICHEYSHCFGLPDFYYGATSYLGAWDIMDSGNYNGNGYRPAGYSAHERMLMGWLTPTELTEPVTVDSMAALCHEPVAYLVRNSGCEDEYYIIENRQQEEWDAQLPSSGIVIFHVDYDPDVWRSVTSSPNCYSVNYASNRNRYTIIPANNSLLSILSRGWSYPYGNNNQLTDTSVPAALLIHENGEGTKLMGKPITMMNVTNGLASFQFMSDSVTLVSSQQETAGEGAVQVFDLSGRPVSEPKPGQLCLVRSAGGIIRKQLLKK